jgi:DNA repair exonuclease SbcCD ATPase subunit
MILRPIKIEIEGFKSFKEKAAVTFPEKGLVLISGYRTNSTLSSGTGKSSIMEAMAFCLDINSTPATELKNDESKSIFAELTLTDGTNTYTLTRNPKFSLQINGKPYESLSTGAKEYFMGNIVKCSEDVLKIITYREQRTKGEFINSTDAQIKEFLTNPLNLGELESASDEIDLKLKDLERAESAIKQKIEGFQTNIQIFSSNLPNEISLSEVESIRQQILQTDLEISKLSVDRSMPETAEISSQLKELESKLLSVRNRQKDIVSVMSKVEMLKKENDKTKQEVMELHNFIEHASNGMCNTCNRDGWNTSQEKVNQVQALIEDKRKKFSENIQYIKNSESLQLELPHLKELEDQTNQSLSALNVKIMSIKMETENRNMPIRLLSDKKASLQMNLDTLEKIKLNRQRSIEQIAAMQKNLNDAQVELLSVQKQAHNYSLALKMIGRDGFMGSIFDEILLDIQSRANDMISEIPNVNEFVVKIDSNKEVKGKGTTKKQINVSLQKHGKTRTLRQLSGGQQCSIELCTDLAASEAIRSRSGSALGWVCLDEAMDGFGVEEKQAAIDMIKSRVNGLVIIIDHATEIKESFDKVIQIEYNGRESYVVSQ